MEIKKPEYRGELTLKRLDLTGPKIVGVCNNCCGKINHEIDGDGISYPELNKPYKYFFNCKRCSKEYHVKLVFNLRVEIK